MIKDLDNAVIISVDVYSAEKDTIKDGDVLVWNTTENRWELGKAGLTITSTVFGVVCDTNDGAEKRLICIEGMCEANIEGLGHSPNSLLFFQSNSKNMTFTAPENRQVNAYLLKYLPSKYGSGRGLIKIWNNTNYEIVIP